MHKNHIPSIYERSKMNTTSRRLRNKCNKRNTVKITKSGKKAQLGGTEKQLAK